MNLDPLSEVTQLNNYSYHEAKSEKTASDFIHIRKFVSSEYFVRAAKLPREKTEAASYGKGGSC